MHTRAFSNGYNELLLEIEGTGERISFAPFHNRTFLISRGGISLITGLIIVTPKLKLGEEFYSSMV